MYERPRVYPCVTFFYCVIVIYSTTRCIVYEYEPGMVRTHADRVMHAT